MTPIAGFGPLSTRLRACCPRTFLFQSLPQAATGLRHELEPGLKLGGLGGARFQTLNSLARYCADCFADAYIMLRHVTRARRNLTVLGRRVRLTPSPFS